MTCYCGGQMHIAYCGDIRDGKWPGFKEDVPIWECKDCNVQMLDRGYQKTEGFYKTGEYNDTVKVRSVSHIPYSKHLEMVLEKVETRGALLDVGRGMGEFGHIAEPYFDHVTDVEFMDEIKPGTKYDLVTSFNVIEHVTNPLEFMKEIKSHLKPGGEVLICTPNLSNILNTLSPAFRRFFYRTQHNWYFDAGSLMYLFFLAGFDQVGIGYGQNYGINNLISWIARNTPGSEDVSKYLLTKDNSPLDMVFKGEMVMRGTSDTVYMYAINK